LRKEEPEQDVFSKSQTTKKTKKVLKNLQLLTGGDHEEHATLMKPHEEWS